MKTLATMTIMAMLALASHAQTARQLFVDMPDSLSDLLTAVNRADFIDFMDSNMKAEVDNRLGGKSVMTALTDDYISVDTSSESTWQMKLLPLQGGGQVVCTVTTVCGQACDSHMEFYDTAWNRLDTSDFMPDMPQMFDFLRQLPDTARYVVQDAYRQADMLLAKATLAADGNTLAFDFSTSQYMEQSAAQLIGQYVNPTVVYRWNGKAFRKERGSGK